MFPTGNYKFKIIHCKHSARSELSFLLCNFFHLSFLETSVPLSVLINAAREGNEKEVEECAIVFRDHANKLVEVSSVLFVTENKSGEYRM